MSGGYRPADQRDGTREFWWFLRALTADGSVHECETGEEDADPPLDRLCPEHRVRAQDPAFQAVYRQHRPMVERTLPWMTRGVRRVPYRCTVKNNAWWVNRAAAINPKRLLSLGLTSQNGTWAIG